MIETLHQSEPVALPDRPFGRQARSVAAYSLLTALMIIMHILVFIPAVLFHCAIRNGRRAAWAAAVAALAVAASFVPAVPATTADLAKMIWANFAAVGLGIVLPALVALPLVQRRSPFGQLLVVLLTGSAIGHAVVEVASRVIFSFSPYGLQVAHVEKMNKELITHFGKGATAGGLQLAERWVEYSPTLLPGFGLASISLIFLLSLLMLGRLDPWREHVARRDGDAVGPYLFRNFALPDWMLFAFVAGGLAPLATGLLHQVTANTLLVVTFLYMLQGLAIFRAVLVGVGVGTMGTLLSGLFLVLTVVALLPLTVIGLFDPFFDFRHFKKRKDDSHESHSD